MCEMVRRREQSDTAQKGEEPQEKVYVPRSLCYQLYLQTLIFPRVRALRAEPYTQREAEAAVGLNDASAMTSEEQSAAMELETAGS